MNFLPTVAQLTGVLLAGTMLAGCSVSQPVAELTAKAVVTQLPLGIEKSEARRYCRAHAAEMHGQQTESARTAALNQEIEDFQLMVEEALVYRAETLHLVESVQVSMDSKQPIPGQVLTELNEGLAKHLALRQRLFQVAEAHECWLDANGPVADMTPDQRLKGIMLSLSAALTLYDNYLLAISLYQEDPRLRLLLNNKDVGYGIDYGELNRVSLSFASEETRNRVRQGIIYYEAEIGKSQDLLVQDKHMLYLNQLISQSVSYSMTKGFSPLAYVGRKIGFYAPFTVESLLRLKSEGVNMTSMIFGNSIGLVEVRHGKLDGRVGVAEDLAGNLQAGDILIERTPFRLTDSFIPGYWGHAALWVGSEAELQDMGIWDDPVMLPDQELIRSGRRVVEALRSGVQLNTLDHFLNVDDIAVLRYTGLGPKDKARIILQALRQMGKRYDFNFDVETRDRIGCAELVYHAYGEADWPTRKWLGRSVIVPDDIAGRAVSDGPLVVVRLYIDGNQVTGDAGQVLERLIEQRQDQGWHNEFTE
jgi:hypothetical protein